MVQNNKSMKKLLLTGWAILALVACQNNEKKEADNPEAKQEQISVKEQPAPDFNHKKYKMDGMILAKTTFKVFKSKIEEVGSKQGLTAVVDFCHDNAPKLTDSIGKAHNVLIRRTSHKLRNTKNEPTDAEKDVINKYLELQDENQRLEPIVKKDKEGYIHFYAPIKIKEKCLQCHGKPGEEVKPVVLKQIKEKYPNDKATGFKKGELRGIWDIKFMDKPVK